MRRLAPLLAWLVILASALPGLRAQTLFGRNSYVEYRVGDLPVILVAGHGGDLTPAEIPDRTYGTFDRDTNTRELAIACYDEILARTGRRPHLILSHLRRIKLDPNREIVEAAQGNAFAEQAWNEFHGFIASARATARTAFGFAHLIDLHGHGHAIPRLELGYGLGAAELNLTDAELQNPGHAWSSTLRTLPLARPGVSFPDLLRGPRSLGDLFNRRSIPAWPSPQFPAIGTAEFFNGGHIVRTHTCLLDNGPVHGVQIETHSAGVRDTPEARENFAAVLANVLQAYLWDNYAYDLGTLSVSRIQAPATSLLRRGGPSATVTVRRTGYLGLTTTMAFTLGGAAVRGSSGDYTSSLSVNVFFAAGQTTASFTITPAAPGPAFGDKTLSVTLAPSATQTADLTPLVFTLNDGFSQTVRVHALDSSGTPATAATISEAAGLARFRLTRTQTAAALVVPLLWSGTALPAAHYHDAPASVTFPAGSAILDLTIPLVDDGRHAADRTLALSAAPSAAYFVGHPAVATATIADDDRPAALALWLRGDLDGNIALDSSGHARHATTLPAGSGPSTSTLATPSHPAAPALTFDGADDTLAAPRFILDPDGGFTLAFHFRLAPGGAVSSQNLFSYGERAAPGSLHAYLATINSANGTVALRTHLPGLASNALDISLTSPATWQDGAWRHYALSVSADGTARLHLDGVLRRTATGRTGRLDPDALLWLGWRPFAGPSTAFLRGSFRDVRAYQRPLDLSEITALASDRLRFSAWLSSQALSPALPPATDPDSDGLSLFLEYALAASPAASTPATPRYQSSVVADRLVLSFLRETAAADLVWIVEASSDLSPAWQTIARRSAPDPAWSVLAPGATASETAGYATITDAVALSASPRRFLRLRVEALAP